MAAFLIRSYLSNGNLQLLLRNQNGYAQDAFEVFWSITSHDSTIVSGRNLAIRKHVGEYYAPWIADVSNGNYTITWEIKETQDSQFYEKSQFFFVVDPSSYLPTGPIRDEAIPVPGGGTYLSGTTLIRGDLPLFLKNSDGLLEDAFSVYWTVFDSVNFMVSQKTAGVHASLGEYYAPWFTSPRSGDYFIQWEWQQFSDSPIQSIRMGFSVINPANPFNLYPSSQNHCLIYTFILAFLLV